MKTIPDSLSPSEAWSKLSACSRLPAKDVALAEALDHHLLEPFTVLEDVPSGPRSFMDGFAVRSADTTTAPARLRLAGEILMGEIAAHELLPGEAIGIPTGGYLPNGADAVVMQENTERENGLVVIRRSCEPGENVQARGEDFRRGQQLFPAGWRLRPQDLAAMATFGATTVRVIRRPVVRIVSTGNELVPAEAVAPPPGKIRETNALALASAARKYGFVARITGIVRDDLAAQKEALEKAMADSDVVLISGGSSVGERDYTIPVIQSFSDHRIHFHGLAIRPGNPTIFASVGGRFVFGLPGQPVSSLVVFYQFVLPFLFHLSGETVDEATFNESRFRAVSAKLIQSVRPLKAKTDYLRLRLSRDVSGWLAEPVLGKSASLSTLALADGFAVIPPGETVVPEGAALRVYLFP